jgi:glutaredoxin
MGMVKTTAWRAALALALLGAAAGVAAQYKHVGPDGRVTYSDRPIPGAVARPMGAPTSASADATELPYELRRSVQRYPVTLYTTSPCAPCDAGRTLLRQRGVPFTEITVNGNDDIAELQRRENSIDLPMLRLGAQRTSGFDSADWHATLDAAGYPRTSKLPAGYRATPPRPLVTAPASAASSAASPASPGGTPVITPANGGFRF